MRPEAGPTPGPESPAVPTASPAEGKPQGSEKEKMTAWAYFLQAYLYQMSGELEEAIAYYKRSLEIYPTAEAYTFLGWTYSFMGRYDEAIAECLKAIALDPDFGNPYNDIGAYLIEKGQLDEAVPWLEQALRAKRYASRHFPYYNLGRVWEGKGQKLKAIEQYRRALEIEPNYPSAAEALKRLGTVPDRTF